MVMFGDVLRTNRACTLLVQKRGCIQNLSATYADSSNSLRISERDRNIGSELRKLHTISPQAIPAALHQEQQARHVMVQQEAEQRRLSTRRRLTQCGEAESSKPSSHVSSVYQ